MSDPIVHDVHDTSLPPEQVNETPHSVTPQGADTHKVDNQDVGNAVDGSPEKKEHTRSTMAILFVLGFFAILFLCFVYAIMAGSSLSELKDTLVGVVGALSGILGFIVGYYYKTSQEQ